jgi:hypothetical protein
MLGGFLGGLPPIGCKEKNKGTGGGQSTVGFGIQVNEFEFYL